MEQNRRLQQPQRGHRVGDYSVARQLLYSPGVSENVLPLSGGSGSSGVSKKRHRRWHTQLIGSRKSTGYGSPVCLSTKQNEYSEGEAGADGEVDARRQGLLVNSTAWPLRNGSRLFMP
ncbi:hypothetical protein MY4038_006029 [Beauveria bassiana]